MIKDKYILILKGVGLGSIIIFGLAGLEYLLF